MDSLLNVLKKYKSSNTMQLYLPPNHLHVYYGTAERENVSSFEARRCLKELLALYTDTEANDVNLSYGLNGKPFWKQFPEIQFNVTNAQHVFALAFVRNSRVGIDVENLNRVVDVKAVAEFLLSEKERTRFYSTHEKFYAEQMINAWTRKEAFVKAYGRGMSFPVQQVEVSFLLNETASVNATHWSEREKSEWYLHSFDLAPSYRGAVAVHGKINSVEVRNTSLYCSRHLKQEPVNQL
jgi:4'-phosphopantetheinyl transferase